MIALVETAKVVALSTALFILSVTVFAAIVALVLALSWKDITMLLVEGTHNISNVEVTVDFCREGWSAIFKNKKGKIVGSFGDLQPYSMEYLTQLVKALY